MRRGQAWSIDLTIGVMVFMLIAGASYSLLVFLDDSNTDALKTSSETVAMKIASEQGIVTDNVVDEEKLQDFLAKDYDELKEEFGVNTEFCIYFEDENGNVINITDAQNYSYVGIGGREISIADIECGVAG